jgi:hypothetical protein
MRAADFRTGDVGREEFMTRAFASVSIGLFAVLFAPALARAQEDPVVGICKYYAERATELARAGEVAKVREIRPRLKKSLAVLKDDQMRAARLLVKQYNEALERSKEQPK